METSERKELKHENVRTVARPNLSIAMERTKTTNEQPNDRTSEWTSKWTGGRKTHRNI